MTVKDLKTLKSGDLVKIKRGFVSSGTRVRVLEIIPRDPPLKTAIKFELCGNTKVWPHDRFVCEDPSMYPRGMTFNF